jgi:hypothetical protein
VATRRSAIDPQLNVAEIEFVAVADPDEVAEAHTATFVSGAYELVLLAVLENGAGPDVSAVDVRRDAAEPPTI